MPPAICRYESQGVTLETLYHYQSEKRGKVRWVWVAAHTPTLNTFDLAAKMS